MELFKLNRQVDSYTVKPFLKWAGGKTQLLNQLEAYYPEELKLGLIENYYEPFLGGGAVYFDVVQKYNIRNSYLIDSNEELILVYKVVQNDVDTLIDFINHYKNKYLKLKQKERELFFYSIRKIYNDTRLNIIPEKYESNWIPRAAQMIFLNKTCFNGLFRVNNSGEFNVPYGKHKNPKIIDIDTLRSTSRLLENTEIIYSDFERLKKIVRKNSFVYFDPPYRPISKTSYFTSYGKNAFNDSEQIRLSILYKELDKKSIKLMLSNSDPKNYDLNDNFFTLLYKGYNIYNIEAKRMINCIGEKRGSIKELLITNY